MSTRFNRHRDDLQPDARTAVAADGLSLFLVSDIAKVSSGSFCERLCLYVPLVSTLVILTLAKTSRCGCPHCIASNLFSRDTNMAYRHRFDHCWLPPQGQRSSTSHSLGHEVYDAGSYDANPLDFPDIARRSLPRSSRARADRGLMVCGTGVGASIAANKVKRHSRRSLP